MVERAYCHDMVEKLLASPRGWNRQDDNKLACSPASRVVRRKRGGRGGRSARAISTASFQP